MPRANTLKRQKSRTALLGAFVLILIITLVTTAVMNIFREKPAPKLSNIDATNYENYIAPLVILDVSPFASVAKASQDQLLLSSIWSVLLSKDASKYEYADDGRMILPQTDVDASYQNLFGSLPKHKSISSEGPAFDYSSADKCYYIPVQGIESSFSPHIVSSKKVGNDIALTVEYIPQDNWQEDSSGKTVPAKANKKMIYTIEKTASKMKIISILKG